MTGPFRFGGCHKHHSFQYGSSSNKFVQGSLEDIGALKIKQVYNCLVTLTKRRADNDGISYNAQEMSTRQVLFEKKPASVEIPPPLRSFTYPYWPVSLERTNRGADPKIHYSPGTGNLSSPCHCDAVKSLKLHLFQEVLQQSPINLGLTTSGRHGQRFTSSSILCTCSCRW